MTRNKPTVPTTETQQVTQPIRISHTGAHNHGNNLIVRNDQLNGKSRAILPKWLDAMKDAMIQDANVADRGMTAIYERNDQRLRVLRAAVHDIAPEIQRLDLGRLFQMLIKKAEAIKEIYDEQLFSMRYELAVNTLTAAFANDRRQATLALRRGMTMETRGRLPVRTEGGVETRSLCATMSIEDMFAGTMEL